MWQKHRSITQVPNFNNHKFISYEKTKSYIIISFNIIISFLFFWYRGYYRCTYRKSQGCEATKQVQRSNENHQMLFEISYRGIHSCSQAANVRSAIPVRVLEPNQPQEHENLEMVKESLDAGHHNYNHQSHLHQTLQYHLSSTPTLESNNMMLQLADQNIDLFGSTSFSSDLGANVNYDYLASHNVGSVSHSTSNSPSESPFESFDPNNPFKGFRGF